MTKARKFLWVFEFTVLFFGIPLLIFLDKDFIHPSIIVLPVLVFVFVVLRRSTDFQWKELIRWGISRTTILKHASIALGTLVVMLSYVGIFDPEHLFDLPRSNPWIFVAMCVFYPVFSAYGQEVIYRTFLFRRYGPLLKGEWVPVILSGVAFSFLHIVYYHPVSMVLTLIGGLYFARVYQQTRSVLFTAVMHGIMGMIVFGVGLGRFFWLDIPI